MVYDEMHAVRVACRSALSYLIRLQLLMPTPDLETPLRSFVAGATAGVSSVAITYPLELIRVRLAYEIHNSPLDRPSTYAQITRLVANEPGGATVVGKFYRGFGPTLVGMVPYAGTSFLVWDQLRAFFTRLNGGEPSTTTNLACGAAAGVLSQTASYPFEVVRRRMQVHPRPFLATVKEVYRLDGLRAFYVGLSIGYLKVVPMTAIRCAACTFVSSSSSNGAHSFTTWQGCKRLFGV
jgi:solute carrier family 25 protein 16